MRYTRDDRGTSIRGTSQVPYRESHETILIKKKRSSLRWSSMLGIIHQIVTKDVRHTICYMRSGEPFTWNAEVIQ